MARIGRYKRPYEMQDEDKWFRFFTVPQLLYLFCFGLFGVAFFIIFRNFGLTFVGLLFALIFIAAGIIIPRYNMPDDKYLWGGGISVQELICRIIAKKLPQNKVIYIKMYEEDEE